MLKSVFSNVISLPNNQIKFVDVRGIDDGNQTCFGHPLYDYAKIYQSLIGYDEILLDKKIKVSYKKTEEGDFERDISLDRLHNLNNSLIIVDEANAYKSPQTARWKTLAKLLKPETRLWMMTGTPASQSPVDAYGLAKLVCPQNVPKFAMAWRDKVMHQVTRFKWIPKPNAKNEVFKALQPAIRFAKDDCLDLPEVLYTTREVPLTPQVQKYYKMLKEQMMIETAGTSVSAVNAAAGLNKLLQISGGAVYTDKREVIEFDIRHYRKIYVF